MPLTEISLMKQKTSLKIKNKTNPDGQGLGKNSHYDFLFDFSKLKPDTDGYARARVPARGFFVIDGQKINVTGEVQITVRFVPPPASERPVPPGFPCMEQIGLGFYYKGPEGTPFEHGLAVTNHFLSGEHQPSGQTNIPGCANATAAAGLLANMAGTSILFSHQPSGTCSVRTNNYNDIARPPVA